MVSTTTAPSAVKPAAAAPAALYLKEEVQAAIDGIISYLTPNCELHRRVAKAFAEGDYRTVKRLASTNLSDSFSKAYMYLCSAPKLTPGTDNILAESARAAAFYCRQQTLQDLGQGAASVSHPGKAIASVLFALESLSTYEASKIFQQAFKHYQDGDVVELSTLALSKLDEPFLQAVRALAFSGEASTHLDSQEYLREAVVFTADAKEAEVLQNLSKIIEDNLKFL